MNPLLFGHSSDERITAVQPVDDGVMRLYVREQEGIRTLDERFFPFFYLSDRTLLDGFRRKHWVKRLEGDLFYAYLCAFEEWSAMWDAVRHILETYNRSALMKAANYGEIEQIYLLPDPVAQFLMQTGRTLFKGLAFNDLHRMQIDIETYSLPPHRASIASRPSDRILLIAMADNRGWEHVIDGRHRTERQMLLETVSIIKERDPDVLEGHNIFNFDLPYLATRAGMHSVPLTIGRNEAPVRLSETRTAYGEYPFEYTPVDVPGRHVIDTLLLVQSFDSTRRAMESHGLKYAAQFFGLAAADRTYIPSERIAWYWDHEPASLIAYALDDVRETGRLSEHLGASSFYLSQMVPAGFGHVSRMGAAAKIESLMVREYLRVKHSLPRATQGAQTTGGYTDLFLTGVAGPVVLADVESLYPSIMLTRRIRPSSDDLGIFLELLKDLTSSRLERKREMAAASDPIERSRLDATQSSLKVLINSFYGLLGYSRALFADYAAADAVTTTGQQILKRMIEFIRADGGRVIEVDTDGVYFVPPDGVRDEEGERECVRRIGTTLPEGISVVQSGRFRKMLSYRKKNYALLSYDNRIKVKGSALISRSMEAFGRTYLYQCIDYLLNNDIEGLHALYVQYVHAISDHQMEAKDFGRIETLRETLQEYQEQVRSGKRNRSAAYEVALMSGRPHRPGDKVAYYITGTEPNPRGFEQCKPLEEWDPNFPDENTAYYLRRLEEFSEKFTEFFLPEDFRAIFSSDDLFPFDPKGIAILTRETGLEERPPDDTPPPPRFGIWLDE